MNINRKQLVDLYEGRATQVRAICFNDNAGKYEEALYEIVGFVSIDEGPMNCCVVKTSRGLGSISWNFSEGAFELDVQMPVGTPEKREAAMTRFGVVESGNNFFYRLS